MKYGKYDSKKISKKAQSKGLIMGRTTDEQGYSAWVIQSQSKDVAAPVYHKVRTLFDAANLIDSL